MKLRMLLVLASVCLSSVSWANGLDDCRTVETFSNYDYSSFIFRKDTSETWEGFYRYLLDGSDYEWLNSQKTRRTVYKTALFLFKNNKATVTYVEEEQQSTGAVTWETVATLDKQKFDTTWRVQGGKLVVDNLGEGIAIKCDGNPGALFKLSRNIGHFSIAGKDISFHFGGSNYNPLEE